MLINVKMPTIVGILTFMSRINFTLSRVEHEKRFYNLGASPLDHKTCFMLNSKEDEISTADKTQMLIINQDFNILLSNSVSFGLHTQG